jgi:hypothetical protein
MINYGAIKMRDDDARGTWRHHPPADPHLDLELIGGGGRIPHSFAPSLAYVFGVSVHGLLLVGHSFACNTADGA